MLTPHKKPHLKPAWGFGLTSEERNDHWRVRLRRYDSTTFLHDDE